MEATVSPQRTAELLRLAAGAIELKPERYVQRDWGYWDRALDTSRGCVAMHLAEAAGCLEYPDERPLDRLVELVGIDWWSDLFDESWLPADGMSVPEALRGMAWLIESGSSVEEATSR
jgi:hypothetical protein